MKTRRMKMNKHLIIILLLFFGFVCISSMPSKVAVSSNHVKASKVTVTQITPNLPVEQLNDYVRRVFEEGDTSAYKELWNEPVPYLLCSMVMANKYNYPEAYRNVYQDIIYPYTSLNDIPIDTATFNFAYSYLKRGAELGSKSAKLSMSIILLIGIFVPQDTILARKLYYEANLYNLDSVKLDKSWQRMMKNYSGYRNRKDLKWYQKL